MGFFNKIGKLFSASSNNEEGVYWLYVKCDHCGEHLSSRINLNNDLSVEYEGESDRTYFCKKTLVGGSGCFQRIEVQLTFDNNRKIIERQISGGKFVEYQDFIGEESST